MNNQRLELVADFYEYTMSNGYLNKKMENQIAYFDVFFRKVPDEGGDNSRFGTNNKLYKKFII